MEVESLKADVSSAQEGIKAAEAALKEACDEEDSRQIKVGEVKALYDEAKAALDDFENKLSQYSTELSSVKKHKTSLIKKAEACALEVKKLGIAISAVQKERQSAEKLVSNLLNNYAWIESEQSAFGVAGGDYDFEATNPSEMSKELRKLKAEQDSLVSSFESIFPLFIVCLIH